MPIDSAPFFPSLTTSDQAVDRAYRIALGDLAGNVQPYQAGLLDQPQPVLLAGLDYDTPWTRDAAINVWNGLGLLWEDVARHTLLSVLERRAGRVFIGGQYWDAIIWTVGAWAHFLQTGDREFLGLALEAVSNSLAHFEAEEFDGDFGLFRGPAVYGDGVAAYPDRYSPGETSSILDWVAANPGQRAPRGYGLPMLALSTNCVYAQAYRLADAMARELPRSGVPAYADRAAALVEQVQTRFWNPGQGWFRYLLDHAGGCDYQEGLGHALVLLFEMATSDQARSVLAKQHLTAAGLPCVWPTFPRYAARGGYGRHSGTVWPFISAFWGEAALRYDRPDLFDREFQTLTASLNRHGQCAEIYHPDTGAIYGGLQEGGRGADGLQWEACARQSWTASAYLRLILAGLLGLRFTPGGIECRPYLPTSLNQIRLSGLRYRGSVLDLTVAGRGRRIVDFRHNGRATEPFLAASWQGPRQVEIQLAD